MSLLYLQDLLELPDNVKVCRFFLLLLFRIFDQYFLCSDVVTNFACRDASSCINVHLMP